MTKRELKAKGKSASVEDLKALDKDITFLTAEYIGNVMNRDPQWIRDMARKNPSGLNFPTEVSGTRVYVPVVPFIKYMEGLLRNV